MIKVEKAFECFIESRQAEGRSVHTIEFYTTKLRPFLERCKDRQIDSVTAQDVRSFVVSLQAHTIHHPDRSEGGYSAESIRDYTVAVKVFLNWSWNEYDLSLATNPMRKFKLPPHGTSEPKAISIESVRRLIAATDDSPLGKRDRAILYFLIVTGCRSGGLRTLTPDAIDLDRLKAKVDEKGKKDRPVAFDETCAEVLRQWLAVRPPDAETVFCSLYRGRVGAPLSPSGLHAILNKLAKTAGVTEKVGPHRFRHAFGKALALQGVNLKVIADLLGHSNIATTAYYYTRFSFDEAAAQGRKFNPLSSN
jgi:integrase/recombinase XerD